MTQRVIARLECGYRLWTHGSFRQNLCGNGTRTRMGHCILCQTFTCGYRLWTHGSFRQNLCGNGTRTRMGHCILCQTFTLQLMWELKWVLSFGIVSAPVPVPVPFPRKFCLNAPSCPVQNQEVGIQVPSLCYVLHSTT